MMITWDVILISVGLLFAHLIMIYFFTKKSKSIRGRHVVVTGKTFLFGAFVYFIDKLAATIGKGHLIVFSSYQLLCHLFVLSLSKYFFYLLRTIKVVRQALVYGLQFRVLNWERM